MKNFMVVMLWYEESGKHICAYFFDTLAEAENVRMGIVCGLGGEAEIYTRDKFEYKLLYA